MFGDPDYISHDKIELPLSFGSTDIIGIDKSNIALKAVAGDDAALMDYHILSGLDQNNIPVKNKYNIVLTPAPNTWGAVLVQFVGAVIDESSLAQSLHAITPILISYNNLTPTGQDFGTPYKTADGWWNIFVAFAHPVVKFGIHALITGIPHTRDQIYRALTLDVLPSEPPPAFSDIYTYAAAQVEHCVGDWEYIDLQNTVQARYFWVKLSAPDTDNMPEIFLREESVEIQNALRPVSVAPRTL